jgi:myo-inositol 2-dehydrogenase/D-chiro-inositol 1-dehydrogenase
VTLRTASGAICSVNGMLLNPRGYDIRTEVLGTRDSVVVGQSPRTPQRNLEPGAPPPATDEWVSYLDRFHAAYARELAAFVEVARGERSPSPNVRDALAAMRIAVAATRSLRERRTVTLDEIPDAERPVPEAALETAR